MPHPRPPIISIDPDRPNASKIVHAAARLRLGQLAAFAAETVYGLGADATDAQAVARIFEAKGRPPTNPLIVHVSCVEMALQCVVDWPPAAERLAERFWPGPLTLVLPRSKLIPDIVTAGRETVGVRVPDTTVALWLIDVTDRPIAAPSANRSNRLSPTTARHVADDLGDRVEVILDSGATTVGIESTVLDLTTREPRILRPGPIGAAEIRAALGGERVRDEPIVAPHDQSAVAPGQSQLHYAPTTPLVLLAELPQADWVPPSGGRVGLLVLGQPFGQTTTRVTLFARFARATEAARALYATLHAWDRLGLDVIYVVPPPEVPEWHAIRDRIWRAAGGHCSG